MSDNKPKVIGILLAYKQAKLLESTYHYLPEGVFDDIIIFDDASGDNIKAVAEKLHLPIFIQEHNLGYGGNVKYSLKKCLEMGGDYMVEIHADGQYGVSAIIPGLEKIKQGYDLVLGSRLTDMRQPLRDKMPILTYFADIGLSFIDRLILRVPLTDFHSGSRIYNRRLVNTVDFSHTANDDLFSFQIIALAKYHNLKIGEVPVRCDYRKEHTSITLKRASIYAFQTFWVLFLYIVSKLGIKSRLFD